MIAYVDSSVLLRVVLAERGRLRSTRFTSRLRFSPAGVPGLCLTTHDEELATAAEAMGFRVLGV